MWGNFCNYRKLSSKSIFNNGRTHNNDSFMFITAVCFRSPQMVKTMRRGVKLLLFITLEGDIMLTHRRLSLYQHHRHLIVFVWKQLCMQTLFCLTKIHKCPDGTVTSGLPGAGLDKNVLVSKSVIGVCYVGLSEDSVTVWHQGCVCILGTTVWNKMFFFSSVGCARLNVLGKI